jgi:hypothetical protein
MKKTVCDTCGSENARTYRYEVFPTRGFFFVDLCINCVQDWVLKNQKKLSEVTNGSEPSGGKKVIHG